MFAHMLEMNTGSYVDRAMLPSTIVIPCRLSDYYHFIMRKFVARVG